MAWFRQQHLGCASARGLGLKPAQGACAGLAEDGITPTTGANALLSVLRAAGGARAVFAGHDHGNAWCCRPTAGPPSLCYGRHTGYGGYGAPRVAAQSAFQQSHGSLPQPAKLSKSGYAKAPTSSLKSTGSGAGSSRLKSGAPTSGRPKSSFGGGGFGRRRR